MRKIPTIFNRDWEGNPKNLTREVTPGCEWVFAGEGRATRKFDGTAVKIQDGQYLKRLEIKDPKPIPPEFIEEQYDSETKKHFGWVPVGDGPEDKWHREAWDNSADELLDGTFELVGPKIQGNPEKFEQHELVPHGMEVLDAPLDYNELREWLLAHDYEGIVWHHPDGRMAKLKRRDFA